MSTWKSDTGSALIETLAATTMLLVVMAGLVAVAPFSLTMTENQGHLAARTTEYAQDKMEQLLVLAWGDSTSDTRVFPAVTSGGTGLAQGGSADPNAPAAGYVDYLDQSGNFLASAGTTAPAGWFYKRVWQIQLPPGSLNLKLLKVTATVKSGFNSTMAPISTVTALKTFPF